MEIKSHVPLAGYTSFKLGGEAEKFVEVHGTSELLKVLSTNTTEPIWLLGYGSNTLISDSGLPGLTICLRGGEISIKDNFIIADATVWWDDVVKKSIEHNLWGIELMSEIPGSVGGAAYINITAYGQSIGNRIAWIEAWSLDERRVITIPRSELKWGYKSSIFQEESYKNLTILRVCIELSDDKTEELTYQKAVDVARELALDANNLQDRRTIIIEARNRAGSLWHPNDSKASNTAGSFFRNPLVTREQMQQVIAADESGKTAEQIKLMNTVHGGTSLRVSAAHVMLAAGFKRGQNWGSIKLHDQNVLKLEALPGATAQELYTVVKLIQQTVKQKLNIDLEPEVRILGTFA